MGTAAAGLTRRSAVKPRVTQVTEHLAWIALTHDALLVGITNYKLQNYRTTLSYLMQEKNADLGPSQTQLFAEVLHTVVAGRKLPVMPATYQIDASRKLVLSKAIGVLTAAEMFAHDASLHADPLFQPYYSNLADFSEATDVQATGMEIRRLADESPFRSGARRAFVVPAPLLYGVARMFQIFTEEHGVDMQLFDEVALASRWLGIEL